MQSTLLRRTFLGFASLVGLAALGATALGSSKGPASPPANPEIVFVESNSKNILLRVMNADGSNVKTVVTAGKWDRIDSPCWSPDGARIAFVGTIGPSQGLWVVQTSGTGLQRIVAHAYATLYGAHADWSCVATPDGRDKIVFRTGNPDAVFVVNPDGTDLQDLTSSFSDVIGTSWNSAADAIVCSLGRDLAVRHVAAEPGGGLAVVGETLISMGPGLKGDLHPANTANRMVLWKWNDPAEGLLVLDLAGTPPSVVQITSAGERMPSFSPNDTRLVYTRENPRTRNPDIFTSLANGTGEMLIRSSTPSTRLTWPYWRHN